MGRKKERVLRDTPPCIVDEVLGQLAQPVAQRNASVEPAQSPLAVLLERTASPLRIRDDVPVIVYQASSAGGRPFVDESIVNTSQTIVRKPTVPAQYQRGKSLGCHIWSLTHCASPSPALPPSTTAAHHHLHYYLALIRGAIDFATRTSPPARSSARQALHPGKPSAPDCANQPPK